MAPKRWTTAEESRCLELYILRGMSARQIAKEVDRPPSSVAERLARYLGDELFGDWRYIPGNQSDRYKLLDKTIMPAPRSPRVYERQAVRLWWLLRRSKTETQCRHARAIAITHEVACLLKESDTSMNAHAFINATLGHRNDRP